MFQQIIALNLEERSGRLSVALRFTLAVAGDSGEGFGTLAGSGSSMARKANTRVTGCKPVLTDGLWRENKRHFPLPQNDTFLAAVYAALY